MNIRSIYEPNMSTSTENEFKEEIKEVIESQQKELQLEGIDYKFLYGGSKFFWMTKEDIDFSIYLHCSNSVIEIIPFHCLKSKELNRIYLDLNEIINLLNKQTDSHEKPNDNDIVRYILSRLQLSNVSMVPAVSNEPVEQQSVWFGALKSEVLGSGIDNESMEAVAVLKDPPVKHIPIIVTRRRSTAGEELAEVLSVNKENNNDTNVINKTIQEKT